MTVETAQVISLDELCEAALNGTVTAQQWTEWAESDAFVKDLDELFRSSGESGSRYEEKLIAKVESSYIQKVVEQARVNITKGANPSTGPKFALKLLRSLKPLGSNYFLKKILPMPDYCVTDVYEDWYGYDREDTIFEEFWKDGGREGEAETTGESQSIGEK